MGLTGWFTLKRKLFALVALPLLLFLLYAVFFSHERYQDLGQARDVWHLARATEILTVVHRLQFERSAAVGYASARSEKNLREWRKAAELSDRLALSLPDLRKELIQDGAGPDVLDALDGLSEELENLRKARDQLTKLEIPPIEIQSAYTSIIEHIHVHVSNLLGLASGSRIFQLADSLTAIAEIKELRGRERGLVSIMLNNGSATEAEIRNLLALVTKYEFLSQKFLKMAPVPYQEYFIRLNMDETGSGEGRIVQDILSKEANSTIRGNPERWFATATQRLDGLRELEKNINKDLLDYAENRRGQAFKSLLLSLLVAAATIALVLTLVAIATNKLIEGFIKLRDSAVEFTHSGELKDVALNSSDELGELARAFNRMIAQLRHISHAAEAVASGDFSQQMEVKSERDRLAQSMNHMIKTLRDSVERMQLENWLKTGQGELALQINTDQGVQDLVQKAVTFLAEYLRAPVAAIYLVDHEEVAELCASYAYTFRKEARNRFVKGESLVGQAVRERKTIVVDDLPPDYVRVSSGLGQVPPRSLVVIPLVYAKKVLGVLELGFLHTLEEVEMDLLAKCGDSLAVALHAALGRDRLAEMLEESRAQSEELQAQQEELEQANSELEEQTQQLEESQQELRIQKQQLLEANEELHQKSEELVVRNRDIEARSEELEKARSELEEKAEELMTASKYKSEFLANMSHELRSPLNSLLLLAQNLRENDDGNLTQEQLEAVGIIHGSGQDLLKLINDILDLSKVEAGKLTIEREDCNLADLIQTLHQQFLPQAKDKKLQLTATVSASAPKIIHTDPQRLQQILRNLLSNAIKFTDAGEVALTVEPDERGGLQFHVRDTGIGIPKKLQRAIFEAFQQGDGSTRRKFSGTGLGLTISRELSRLLGGDIKLQSEENKGSLFTLRLPRTTIVAGESVTESLNSPATRYSKAVIDKGHHDDMQLTLRTETPQDLHEGNEADIPQFVADDRDQLQAGHNLLLIIEDDLVFARCMMELAHSRNFQCLVAGDGQSGVQMAQRFKPNAIVLDMVLPDGSGDQVMQKLAEQGATRDIPVHIVSSLDQEDVERGEAIGVLTKPISKESIDNAFNNILKHLHTNQKRRVLVIEDDRNTRKGIEALLRNRDVEVLHAETGQEGLELLEREPVACVILDLNLPDMNSVEVLQKIAGEGVADPLPVIIYTGADLSHEEYKQLRQYTDNIIIKGSLAQERLLNDVILFLHSVQPKGQQSSASLSNDVLKDKKILIVDDDMRNTFALTKLLRRHGVKVVMADNGGLALQKLSEYNDIEIAIMDIMMPEMDGYETIRQIRERKDYKNLPIIAVTAKAMPEDRDKCLQVGANDYLAKPVDPDRLMSALRVWASA